MAGNDPNLRVRISADINDIKQGLALVRQEVSKFRNEAAKAVDLSGVAEGFTNLRNLIGGLFAGVTVGSVFTSIITETREASDELAQLQAVLKSTGQQAGYSQQQLLDMASSMASATTLAAGDIVRAQTRLLSYTGIVGEVFPRALQTAIDQSVRLGESVEQSAETVGKALDKPSQGVTALTKQGFKFTEQQREQMKVLEASGRVGAAQAIVLDAMSESYAGAAASARDTFGGAITAIGNALRDLLDGSSGAGLASATSGLNELVRSLSGPEVKLAFADLSRSVLELVGAFAQFIAQDGARAMRVLIEVAALLARNIDVLVVAVGTALAARAVPLAIAGVQALIVWLTSLRAGMVAATASAAGLRAAFATMGGPITLAITALSTALYYLYQRTEQATAAAEAHAEALRLNAEMAKVSKGEALAEARAKRTQAQETLKAAQAIVAERMARLQDTMSPYARGGDRGDGAGLAAATNYQRAQAQADQAKQQLEDWGKQIEKLAGEIADETVAAQAESTAGAVGGAAKAMARSNELLLDTARRALAELDKLYAENAISIESYFSKRTALQLKTIDLQLDQARAEQAATKDSEGRRRLEEQIVKLQRDRGELGVAAATEQAKAEKTLAASLAQVTARLQELDGNAGASQRAQLEAQYAELFARLRAEGDATGQALVTSLIDRLVAKAKSEELRGALERITSTLKSTESSVGAQVSAGMLGYGEGERLLAAARAKALADMRELRATAVEAMSAYTKGSPQQVAALDGLRELDEQIAQVVQSQNVWRQKVQDTTAGAFGDFLADLSTGAKGFKDAFNDMVRSFVNGVARMLAQEAALRVVQSLFSTSGGGMFGGGGGAAVGAGVSASKFHTGGKVGNGGGTRVHLPVGPLVFGNAPRFHSGGGFGLRSDERAAILQTGERVLNRRQTAAYDSGRTGAGRVRVEIVNNGPPAKVDDASMGKGADGDQMLRLVISAVADDVANGGAVGQAGVARYGWREST